MRRAWGCQVDARLLDFIPPIVRQTLAKTAPIQRFRRLLLEELGIPEHVLEFLRYPPVLTTVKN